MNTQLHEELKAKIWEIASRLRGPYRPPQYRLVMLPIVVLRRLDCVLESTKDAVLKKFEELEAQQTPAVAMEHLLGKAADPQRKHPLYNTSPFTFTRLLADAENIAPNLVSYINGFSSTARHIFERFEFADQIEKLDDSNRLYTIVKAMANIDLHPDRIDNLQMGYLFEHLVMRFNEQANEEAGDHFTPREVIRLMANLIYTGEQDVYKPGIYRTIYDPACGTGGMLSESEKLIRSQNERAELALFGQEHNDESWAICCSDMLIKDEDMANIVLGDTLGDGKTKDGFEGKQFHYLMANPPFGVEWKDQKDVVVCEHKTMGFSGRFGAGLPAIDDGSLLFLQHMISKMHPYEEGNENKIGSKIAIVFNGSPLFSGDAGQRQSNIRRWIIENDWLDTIVALPDQLFYNTGIFTYIWLVTNRKTEERRGKIQLIDGTRFFQRMKKSLNNKRNEITKDQIQHLTRIYGNNEDGETAEILIDGKPETRVVSRIFENREFGFLKVTVERPLRMNFEATPKRIAKLDDQTSFVNLAKSKKRKDTGAAEHDISKGRKHQEAIRTVLATLQGNGRYMDQEAFEEDVMAAAKLANVKILAPIKKAIFAALGERDQDAEICWDSKGRPVPDRELRDTENIPLPPGTDLPLPMDFGPDKPNDRLAEAFQDSIDAYIEREVLPHVSDAWVDYDKTKVGYEIPINRHFYVYKPPRPLDEIVADITRLEGEIAGLLNRLAEKRQALVTHAVTKGLDPDSLMKPSGIDWLGPWPSASQAVASTGSEQGGHYQVCKEGCRTEERADGTSDGFEQQWLSDLPDSWTKKRADFLCTPYRIVVDPEMFGDDLVAHYSIPQVQETGKPLIEPASDIDSGKLLIDTPVLLVSKLNPRKKTICAAVPHPEHPTLASGEFVAIVPKEIDQRYAYYFWCSEKVTARLSSIVQSVTRSHQRVKPEDIRKLPWKWPPLDTQKQIAQFLDEKTAQIDSVIEQLTCSIEHLTEYRSALITAAVIGQFEELI